MKKFFLSMMAFACFAVAANAQAVMSFGNASHERAGFTDKFLVNGGNPGALTYALADGNEVIVAPSTGGKFWAADVTGEWTNEAALAEFNQEFGTNLVNADLSAGTGLQATNPGWQDANTVLTYNLTTFDAGQGVAVYLTYNGFMMAIDNIAVTGLDNMTVSYATNNGDGFVETPAFSERVKTLAMIKVTGNLTAEKSVAITSNTYTDPEQEGDKIHAAKFGVQIGAYKKVAEVPTAIVNVNAENTGVKKAIRNGQVVIVKGNNTYNVAGSLLK